MQNHTDYRPALGFVSSPDAGPNHRAGASATSWLIDLGAVCQSTRVRLNGKDLETVFLEPFRVPVARLVLKDNMLEIEVTNVSANRIRDLDRRCVSWKNFHDINFVDMDYQAFDASKWPIRDSGLLGLVRLFWQESVTPEPPGYPPPNPDPSLWPIGPKTSVELRLGEWYTGVHFQRSRHPRRGRSGVGHLSLS